MARTRTGAGLVIFGGGLVIATFIIILLGAGFVGYYFGIGVTVLAIGMIVLVSNAMKRRKEKNQESANDSS